MFLKFKSDIKNFYRLIALVYLTQVNKAVYETNFDTYISNSCTVALEILEF